jgi:hypothetical protein
VVNPHIAPQQAVWMDNMRFGKLHVHIVQGITCMRNFVEKAVNHLIRSEMGYDVSMITSISIELHAGLGHTFTDGHTANRVLPHAHRNIFTHTLTWAEMIIAAMLLACMLRV